MGVQHRVLAIVSSDSIMYINRSDEMMEITIETIFILYIFFLLYDGKWHLDPGGVLGGWTDGGVVSIFLGLKFWISVFFWGVSKFQVFLGDAIKFQVFFGGVMKIQVLFWGIMKIQVFWWCCKISDLFFHNLSISIHSDLCTCSDKCTQPLSRYRPDASLPRSRNSLY
jgi:hypothetical protein